MSEFKRRDFLKRLEQETFDVLIIGGGVTGAGCLLDCASRGLSVALVEKGDFASGTSSKSSKLIHGGLRYLQQKDFYLVYEALLERQILLRNAKGLVEPLEFLVPVFGKNNKAVERLYSSALWLYDLTGGFRIGKLHKKLTKEKMIKLLPFIPPSFISSGFSYYDARTDDARFVLELLKYGAHKYDAISINYAGVNSFIKESTGKVAGATLTLKEGNQLAVKARCVINATGIFADDVRFLDEGTHPNSIAPAKGIHISFKRDKIPVDKAVILPVAKDKRSIFLLPWYNYTYVGTTDNLYSGDLDNLEMEEEDISYLLNAVNKFSETKVSPSDITGAWIGIRPLISSNNQSVNIKTQDLSRRHRVTISKSGVITVTGGKFTTYRKMAKDAVDLAVKYLGFTNLKSRTKHLKIRDLTYEHCLGPRYDDLVKRYGNCAVSIFDREKQDPSLNEYFDESLPYKYSEVSYSIENEMALTLDDLLSRRTRITILNKDVAKKCAPKVAKMLSAMLGYDKATSDLDTSSYLAQLDKIDKLL